MSRRRIRRRDSAQFCDAAFESDRERSQSGRVGRRRCGGIALELDRQGVESIKDGSGARLFARLKPIDAIEIGSHGGCAGGRNAFRARELIDVRERHDGTGGPDDIPEYVAGSDKVVLGVSLKTSIPRAISEP